MEFVNTLVNILIDISNDQSREYRIINYCHHLGIEAYVATKLDEALMSRTSGLTKEQIVRKAVSLLVLDEGVGVFNAQMEIYSDR